MSAPSPQTSKSTLTTFALKVDGNEIDSSYLVQSILVRKAVNKISYAEIEILDGAASDGDFPISNKADFLPGAEVEIEAGYQSTNSTIYKGIITAHGLQVAKNEGSVLRITCRDKAIKMTLGRKSAFFQEKKDSDIISSLIGDSGASADVEATELEHPNISQYYVTDYDFMLMRADVNGMVVLVDDGKVSVKAPDTSTSAVISATYGDSILSFDAQLNSVNQIDSATGYAWDMSTQKLAEGSGSASATTPGNVTNSTLAEVIGLSDYVLQSPGNVVADELTSWASAKLLKSKIAKIDGSVSFQGSALVKPGVMITLDGVGDRFNGDAYVTAVEHTIEDGDWVTKASFGLNFDWFEEETPNVSAPPASGLLPSVSGLQTGKVMEIHEDPDGEFRVKIKLPIMQQDSDGIWARYAQFYGTSGAGSFFYPEVDDEVVVGFLNDDPRYPVILGMLYSSKISPPYTPEEKNETKAIVTKEKLKIEFNEKDKVITVITPGENQLVLDDKSKGITIKDQNDNKIEMSSSGITIKSPKSINIEASQAVNLKGGTDIALKATSKMSLKGMQFEATADTTAKVAGNASAEISASGTTTVKGAMVMIN